METACASTISTTLFSNGSFVFCSDQTCLNRWTVSAAVSSTSFSEILAFAARCFSSSLRLWQYEAGSAQSPFSLFNQLVCLREYPHERFNVEDLINPVHVALSAARERTTAGFETQIREQVGSLEACARKRRWIDVQTVAHLVFAPLKAH